jgi:hypothetical protein
MSVSTQEMIEVALQAMHDALAEMERDYTRRFDTLLNRIDTLQKQVNALEKKCEDRDVVVTRAIADNQVDILKLDRTARAVADGLGELRYKTHLDNE